MDFELSDEQHALQAAARDLLDDTSGTERVREVAASADGFDARLWKHMADQGWLALELDESAGGLGLGFVEVAAITEEIGRHATPAPFLSNALASSILRRADTAAADVERLASGEAIATVVFGGELAVDAPIADLAITVGDDVRLHRVRGLPRESVMDLTRTAARFEASGGEVLGADDLVAFALDRGAALYAMDLLGIAGRMLDESVEYAKVREQFGQPIGSFQAVKHRLADALVDVEGMRSAAYYAAWAVSVDTDDRSLAASMAKTWCGDAAGRVLDSALQVHGGIGFTWEHDLHVFLKRALLDERVFGDARFHRDRLAGLLRLRVESGAELW